MHLRPVPAAAPVRAVAAPTALGLIALAFGLLVLADPPAARAQDAPAAPEEEATEIPPRAERIRAIPFFTYEREGERKTARVLDLFVLRLLEVGGGEPDYRRLAVLDTPIFHVFRHRKDGGNAETRFFDAHLFALLRHEREGPERSAFHIFKLPLVGSLFAHEREPGIERWRFLFAFRREVKR